MIDKSESVNWPNVWWILGADHLTFEGVIGDFRKKMSCRLISGGKKHANKFLGKNILPWKKYRSWRIMLKKNLTPLYVGEKISNSREVWEKILPIQTKSVKSPIRYSPTNVQWSCQPFRGWGKKRIWHLCKCHPSTKWLARDHDVVVFKTKVLHFKIENTPIKDTNGKRKFKRMLSFLFVDKRKLFALKLSFEEFNLVFYTADRSAWLVLNKAARLTRFWRHLRYIPYSMIKESTLLKGNFWYL